MTDDLVKVTVADGKYTFGQRKDGSCYALRYGDPWREGIFDGLTLAMAHRIEELVATNEALTEQLAAARQDAKEAEAYAWKLEEELRDTQDRANAFATKEYYTEMRAERAEAKLAKAVERLTNLEKSASEVSRYGAATGPQWAKMSIAILAARTTLAEIKSHSDEFATQKGESHE